MVGCSPAWPNPGGAQSGLPRRGRGQAPARLRPGGAGAAADGRRRLAAGRRDRDHPLPPRPLGRHRAVGVGADVRPRPGLRAARALAASGRRGAGRRDRLAARLSGDVRRDVRRCGSTRRACRSRRRGSASPRCASRTTGWRRTPSGSRASGRSLAYSGDTAPGPALAEVARDADLFLCEATIGPSNPDPDDLRGHLSADEARAAFEASGAARLLLTHRPVEQPLEPGLELVHDGYSTDV